jgi:cell wall-associated NlpC family hydrolase
VAQVRLPDNRLWWVESQGLLPYDRCPKPDAEGIDFTLRLMQRFIGVPYHWGGRTPFGFDCSGLSQTFLSFLGVSAPRDASQQFLAGVPVEGARQPGDLLFFGETLKNKRVKVTHVAISLGGDEIIHANGVTWNTAYNSLDPQSPIYRGWLRSTLVGVRRFV